MLLLSALADAQGPMGVKQVAEQLQLAPSTAHRLLQLLRKEGFVDAQGNGQYVVGTQFYRVAARVAASVSTQSIALPFMEAIANEFDETVLFGLYLPAQRAMSFTARADGTQLLKYQIEMHRPLSLLWGASGKAILAFLPTEDVRTILEGEAPSPATGESVPSFSTLEPELARIRTLGYAVSDGEKLPDARGIAAPVHGPRGVVGCLCLTSPKSRVPHADVDTIGRRIIEQANAISRALGAA